MKRTAMGYALLTTMAAACVAGASENDRIPFEEPDGDRVVVEVLNASGIRGLARSGTIHLRRAGLDVVAYATADTTVDATLVLVRRGEGDGAGRVVRALGTGTILVAIDTLRRVDVTVLLGPDFQPPPTPRP
jgi:hypothetical protein